MTAHTVLSALVLQLAGAESASWAPLRHVVAAGRHAADPDALALA